MAVLLLLAIAAGVLALAFLRDREKLPPLQFEQRCVATADGRSVTLTREQAYFTAIITGVSVQRGLDPHAATIAMATAYQETGIRNLDHGDRDSVGLFQQRPSKGWGTPQQLQDPWYATGAFYDALVKIPGWETADVNDTAQAVQRSGYPQAYRAHEEDARVLAKAFTGQRPAAVSCYDERSSSRAEARPDQIDAFTTQLALTHGAVEQSRSGKVLTVTTRDPEQAWAVAAFAVTNAGLQGVARVESGLQTWQPDGRGLPAWVSAGSSGSRSVVVTFR